MQKYLVYHKYNSGYFDTYEECKLFDSKRALDKHVKTLKRYHGNDTQRLIIVKLADIFEDYTRPAIKLTPKQEKAAEKSRRKLNLLFGKDMLSTVEALYKAEIG